MNAFKVLLRILVSIINTLNEEGFKLYDSNDTDYYISNIRYESMDNRLYFDTEEDK